MQAYQRQNERHMRELRLFLEEICCDLCRFQHVHKAGLAPEDVHINQEGYLGIPGSFGDIRIQVPGAAPYFVEVKYGYPHDRIVTQLARKYGEDAPGTQDASKIILVVDVESHENWSNIEKELQARIRDGLQLEVWNEECLFALIRESFDVEIHSISEDDIVDLRVAIDSAKGLYAFGDEWTNDSLQLSLLWNLGFWRLRQLREQHRLDLRSIMPPGLYKGIVVLLADLCSFSSYVRDTHDEEVIRQCLTSFYSKARYEILNTGGMLYQFVGDEVSGLFGIPDHPTGYLQAALKCAKALADIGDSVSNKWQRQIDRVQNARGVHIGMAIGDIQIVSLRPFGRAHLGAVGDSINMAARLLAHAGPSEIVISNTYYQALDVQSQGDFQETGAVEARNVGKVKAWKLGLEM